MVSRAVAADKMRQKALKRKMRKEREEFGDAMPYDPVYVYVTNAIKPERKFKAEIATTRHKHRTKRIIKSIVCPECKEKHEATWDNRWKAFKCTNCGRLYEMLSENDAKNFGYEPIERHIKKAPKIKPHPMEARPYSERFYKQDFYEFKPGEFFCTDKDCERHDKKPFKTYEAFLNHYIDKHAPERIRNRYIKRKRNIIKTDWVEEIDMRITKKQKIIYYRKRNKRKDEDGNDTGLLQIKDKKKNLIYDVCGFDGCLKTIKTLEDESIDYKAWEEHLKEHKKEFGKRLERDIYCPVCNNKTYVARWNSKRMAFECSHCNRWFEGYDHDRKHIFVRDLETKRKYKAKRKISDKRRKRMVARGHYKQEKRNKEYKEYTDWEFINSQIKLKQKHPKKAATTGIIYIN